MKPFIKVTMPLLALFAAFSSHAAEIIPPTAVSDLYIKTLVNHDDQAIRQLNDYLRPDRLRSGRSADYANAAELKEADKAFPGEIAEMAQALFPEPLREGLRSPLESLMTTVQQARQKSECKSLSAGEPEKDSNGILTTQVTFECVLVKTNETWAEGVQRLAKSNCSASQCSSELKKLQDAYSAPVSFTYQGTFSLSKVPQDKDKAWRNDFASETFDEMLSQF
ncbi:hypothetical protein BV921_11240 [Pectobacterium odoriferum]|uniref:hypothetical protein n=1 Tax=Pectobacterium odoriferum TaxID=78398 RepID=UPI000CD15A51|nr:hypothetical protein [Pectobacterium odoriferum]POE09682.1 hypothetical protein BV921_11240 [Pectobacterium odoriferum]